MVSACWHCAIAQSSWTNYTNDRLIEDVQVAGPNIWVASQGGLTRTNLQTGEFETYLACNSPIRGGGVSEIERAPDNSLWFVSENAGVFNLKNGEWTHYYDGIISEHFHRIQHLQILPNGDVWFFIDLRGDRELNRLVRIRNGEIEFFGNLPGNIVSFVVIDEHSIFISDATSLHQYDASLAQVTSTFNTDNSILRSDDTFRDIISDKNGNIIIPCLSRILQLKDGVISLLSTPGASVLKAFKDGVGNVYLQTYTEVPNGIRLVKYDGNTVSYFKNVDFAPYPAADVPQFVGAENTGGLYATVFNVDSEYILYRFDENGWRPVKSQIYPLLNNYQKDVQSDCEGNLWFDSRNGVDVRYADGAWEHFTVNVDPANYFSVAEMSVDPNTCDVWFANDSGGDHPSEPSIVRISNGVLTNFLPGENPVSAIKAADDGRLYFFIVLRGFGYIENDEVHFIDEMNEVTSVNSIDIDSRGNLYLATLDNTLLKYDGSTIVRFVAEELGQVPVYKVYVDNDDFIWVYFSGGVKMFDGAIWHDYSDIWPSGTFNGIVQDRRGNYWVSTWHDGLYYWDLSSLQQYTIFNSDLTTNSLRNVALDPDGNLIVTQHVGASVLEMQANSGVLKGVGTVFFDVDKDGLFQEDADFHVSGQKVRNVDRNLWAVTNILGKYAFYNDQPESSHFQHECEEHAVSTTDNPQIGSHLEPQSSLPDFGYWKPHVPEVDVTIVSGVPICNRDFRIQIFLRNRTPYSTLGHYILFVNELLTLVKSSIPPSLVSSGEIVFEDLIIEPFGVLVITLDFTAPSWTVEGPGLLFRGIYSTSDGTFEGSTTDLVRCSYDPNDKKVEPTGDYRGDHSLIADPLKYTIRFQNEGTYKAFDITIMDTLPPNLDPSTFELLGSSHDVETTITDEGVITFFFPNIDLPTKSDDDLGSQGFVAFTIKPDSAIAGLETILNTAHIYFDFNPPIVTNMSRWNVVENFDIVSTKDIQSNIAVHPNPTDGTLYLTMDAEGDYLLVDALGSSVAYGKLQAGNNSIELDVPSGVYYLQVRDATNIFNPIKIAVIR